MNARDLSTGDRGLVSVAALPSIGATILPRIIARFREQSPGGRGLERRRLGTHPDHGEVGGCRFRRRQFP
jgi:DNA-binding transcriptional LysR family regulator